MASISAGAVDQTFSMVLRTLVTNVATTGATITDIDMQYTRNGETPTAKVDATELAATNTVHTDNKMKELDATDQAGAYRTDWPDAAFAAGTSGVTLSLTLVGSFVSHLYVELDAAQSSAPSGAAVSTPPKDSPDGFVIAFGENEANTEDSAHAADGTFHDLEAQTDGTEKIDAYYIFSIGSTGVPTSVSWIGYLDKGTALAKNITVQAYNWGGTAWDQIGSIESSVASMPLQSFTLFTTHVGTGANVGLVHIRFLTGSVAFGATTKIRTDQIFVSYAISNVTVGYQGGMIWYDDTVANTGTESYVDGTADNPVSTWAAVLTLSAALNINQVHIANGSSVTLTANTDNFSLFGEEWTLALASQSCDDAYFEGAHVTGTCTGSEVVFKGCDLAAGGGTLTVAGIEAHGCALAGSIVLTAANTYSFDQCYSGVAGTATPDLDFGAAVANQNVNFRHYSGGIEIKNIGGAGTDNMSLEGHGQLVLNANCAGGTIAIRGNFTVTDNASAAVTLSEDARIDVDQILDALTDDSTKFSGADIAIIKARIGAFTGTGVNTLLGFLLALMKKDAADPSDVGGTYAAADDSNEAIRERGDVEWVTSTSATRNVAMDTTEVQTEAEG